MTKAAGSILAVFMFFSILSCSPIPPPTVSSGVQPSVNDLLTRLDLKTREFRTISGLAKISYKRDGKKKSASQVVLAEYPEKLRLETLGLFGSPALIATTDGEQAVVLFPGEGRSFVGSPDSGFLQKVTGLPLSARDIVAIILLRPVMLQWDDADVSYPDTDQSLLLLKSDRRHQEIEFDQQLQINRISYFVDGKLSSTIFYGQYETGFPQQVGFSVPARKLEVQLVFSELETNIEHKNGMFRIVPPAEYTVEVIPDS